MGDKALNQDDADNELDEAGNPAPEPIEDEIDIVLESDEVEEPQSAPKPIKRNPIRDLRERNKELKGRSKTLEEENASLRAQLDGKVAPAPKAQPAPVPASDVAPTMESCGYDADVFTQRYAAWSDAVLDAKLEKRMGSTAVNEKAQKAETSIKGHYERATALKVANYEAVEDAAVAVLGANLITSIQTTIDNSETLIYWLGKNPDKAKELAEVFASSPGKGTFELGKLSARLTLKPKGKQPPNPDIPLKGGGQGPATGNKAYQKAYKELQGAYDKGDLALARQVRKNAEAQGFKLPFNVSSD